MSIEQSKQFIQDFIDKSSPELIDLFLKELKRCHENADIARFTRLITILKYHFVFEAYEKTVNGKEISLEKSEIKIKEYDIPSYVM